MSNAASMFTRQFFHGTRADLEPGDMIRVGYPSNFTEGRALSWVYFAGLRARWTPLSGGPNWHLAMSANAFMS